MTPGSTWRETHELAHRGAETFLRGDPTDMQSLFSTGADVTLANPFGPTVVGHDAVAQTAAAGAGQMHDGRMIRIEQIAEGESDAMAYVVLVEHAEARLGDSEEVVTFSRRVTMVFRPENGRWVIAHRHADSVTTGQSVNASLAP